MSVKFQETVQTKVTEGANKVAAKASELSGKNEDLSHKIGEYLTGGDSGKGYLAVRKHPPHRVPSLTRRRHTSSNYKQTPSEQRC